MCGLDKARNLYSEYSTTVRCKHAYRIEWLNENHLLFHHSCKYYCNWFFSVLFSSQIRCLLIYYFIFNGYNKLLWVFFFSGHATMASIICLYISFVFAFFQFKYIFNSILPHSIAENVHNFFGNFPMNASSRYTQYNT